MAQNFAAKVDAWTKMVPERTEAVFKQSVQRVLSEAQYGGNMPIDTGFLRASLVVSIGADIPLQTIKPEGAGPFAYDDAGARLTIEGANLDNVITAAWTATYARHVEYGARGRAGRRFLALSAQQWPRIVSEVAAEARARTGA